MNDLISRQAAINLVEGLESAWLKGEIDLLYPKVVKGLIGLPSAQPEITDGQAVEHLQASGWMQNHDKQMYEMGLRERLADDSDSYDALLPSAQSEEDCDTCKHGYFGDDQCNNCRVRYPSHYERRTDEQT